MPRRGDRALHRAQIAMVIGLVILLIGAATFSASATPVEQQSQQPQQENVEAPAPEAVESEKIDIENSDDEAPIDLGPEIDPEVSGTEQLLRSLNQLNTALSPLAVGDENCNNADPGTGAYAETLCWLDFAGFTTKYSGGLSVLGRDYTEPGSASNGWGNIQNYPVNVDLGGGYVLTAKLDVTGENNNGKRLEAASFPTWPQGSFLGNTIQNRSFYTGVSGKPALYQGTSGGQTALRLKDIAVTKGGKTVRDYSIVVADAESTDGGEWIEWTTTGAGFRWLPNTPNPTTKEHVMGNACTTQRIPEWNSTTTPPQRASCAGGGSPKNGTAMLASSPGSATNFSITQRMKGNGNQGVAFGVIVARATIETKVNGRIVDNINQTNDATNFTANIYQAADNTVVATTQTGSSASGSEASSALPVNPSGTQLKFSSSMSDSDLTNSYTPAWRCEKVDPTQGRSFWPTEFTTSPTPPSSSEPFNLLRVGQSIKCIVEYSPPYLTLLKEVDNGTTAATHTAADFTLRATRETNPVSMIQGPGNEAAAVTKRPVAVGRYALQETSPDPQTQGNWPYDYDWDKLECTARPGSTPGGEFSTTLGQDGTVEGGILEVNRGNDVVCTYRNVAREPQLEASKEVYDAEGNVVERDDAVNAGETISYKLTFRNSGTAPMELNYVDHLADVLDDAQFVSDSVRVADGTETTYPTSMANPGVTVTKQLDLPNPQLGIEGSVQRAQTRTVWFQVIVLPNQENADSRQAGVQRESDETPNQVGYTLSNYLLPAGNSVPEVCPEAAGGEASTCTQHPVPAWSVSKDSRPADGARLHKGGNTHYQITASKMNLATSVDDLVFEDDLTHVFKTAGWAPDAAVPGGALKRGIYFFDENNQSLDAAGSPIGTVAVPAAAFDENSGYVPEPTFDSGRWIIQSLPVTLPLNAIRAEMWFAVEAGERPVDIPPSWPLSSDPPYAPITPPFGSRYVNYVRAQAQDGLPPNQCSLSTTGIPDTGLEPTDQNPHDPNFPESCRVTHQMSDNYFTIRKDARGAGIKFPESTSGWGDATGLTNMVGHEFEIRDDDNGSPSNHPSKKLCRTEYHPDIWDGEFISEEGDPDWSEDSATILAIIEHNNTVPEDEQLPLCGLFYPQGTYGGKPPAGGQDGRWRSEYLTEGDYWLVETKAPGEQINNAGTAKRSVPGVQLLAQPIGFTVWPEGDAPVFGDSLQSMKGRGQLDVHGLEQQRCSPGVPVGERPVACVNPTGYLMIVQDVVPIAMPLTGGKGTTWLIIAGSGVITATLIGLWFWRRNLSRRIIGGENPM